MFVQDFYASLMNEKGSIYGFIIHKYSCYRSKKNIYIYICTQTAENKRCFFFIGQLIQKKKKLFCNDTVRVIDAYKSMYIARICEVSLYIYLYHLAVTICRLYIYIYVILRRFVRIHYFCTIFKFTF